MSGQQHALAALSPRKVLVPIVQEAEWAPGPVWTGRKSCPHRDSIPDRPARSQSLFDNNAKQLLKVIMNFSVTGDISGPNNFTIIIIAEYGRKREAAWIARVVYEH